MHFALSDDQVALRDGIRELLAGECPPTLVRAAWSDPADIGRGLWRELTRTGLTGAAVAASRGGLGLGACDIVPLLQEAGRVAAPVPLVATAFVAAPLLAAAGRERELQAVLAGECLVACALDGGSLAAHGRLADLILVSAAAGAGLPVRMIQATGGLPAPASIDPTRAPTRISADATGAELDLDSGDIAAAWRRGALGTAAELLGLARTLLSLTTAYVTERRQFGVAVGSFQAVKHHLADALIAIEFAEPAVMRAAWSLDHRPGSEDRDVAMAKALASEAAEQVAAIALQCHGAIAYTTEYDLHLFAKRIWATSRTWGSAEWQRERVAVALGL